METKEIVVGDKIAIKVGDLVIHATVTEVADMDNLFGEDADTMRVLLAVKG